MSTTSTAGATTALSSSFELKMNSATKVGEIFTKAGDSYNKIGDMLVMLHPSAQDLIALEEANQQKLLAAEQQQQQQLLAAQQLAAQQQQAAAAAAGSGAAATITLAAAQQQQQQAAVGSRVTSTSGPAPTTPQPAPTYISIGGVTVPVINGTVTLPAGGIHGIQAGQTLQLGDGTLIKTEAAPAGQMLQLSDGTLIKTEAAAGHSGVMGADVSALLEAAVSQASEPVQPGGQPGPGGGPATQFIKFEDTPVVANEEEIGGQVLS